ncbi:hypothetical protein G6F35_018934 [Rhizopus arrhizus]|nr:hypothetical protein G6F35_018934 [Rhizopus arrhizus]
MMVRLPDVEPRRHLELVWPDAARPEAGLPAVVGQQTQRRPAPFRLIGRAPAQFGGNAVVAVHQQVGLHGNAFVHDAFRSGERRGGEEW